MKHLSKLYFWVLLAPAFIPLFYMEWMMYPLMSPKTLALRTLGIIALSLFTYLILNGQPFFLDRLRQWKTWIPAAILILAYISSIFGYDFYHSFWSTFERGDGLLTLTVCVEYFYLLLISVDKKFIIQFFKIVACVGTLSSVYLIIQWIMVSSGAENFSFIVKPNGRVGGMMGNAAFLSAYLGMTFFATLAAIREYKGLFRNLLFAGACLQIFSILLAATRGTMLALVFIGASVLIYNSVNGVGRARTFSRITLIFFAAFACIFFIFHSSIQRVPIEPIRRIASISLSDTTVSSRLFIWNNVSRESFGHSLLGYGAENINVPFNAVYDPTQIIEEWFDRSHNSYLDYFVQFGIAGLLLYLTLIIITARFSWQLWKTENKYGLFMFGIISVYAMQNFFVFDTGVTLWFMLALSALAFTERSSQAKETYFSITRKIPYAGSVLGILILFAVIPVSIQPLRANLLAFESYQYQIVDVARANASSKKGLSLDTYADIEFGYNAYFMYTEEQINRLSGDELKMAYENAVMILTNSFNHYIFDVRTAVYLAQVITNAPPGVTIDKDLLSSALERAIRLSPKRAQPWYILANLSISSANSYQQKSPERVAGYKAAQDILKSYIELVPYLAEPHFVLAQLLYASGDISGSVAEAEKGKLYYKSNLNVAMRAASYYENIMDLQNASFFLEEILRYDPENTAAKEDLEKIQNYERSK